MLDGCGGKIWNMTARDFYECQTSSLKSMRVVDTVSSVRLLNFSLGCTKLVTPKGKNQHTLRKLWYLAPKAIGEPSKIGHIFTK